MEETTVLIVGAGPSGLALGTTLGRMGIKTIIVERDAEVGQDPRGIAIVSDAVRMSYQLGLGSALTTKIGQEMTKLYFHHKSFNNSPFMHFDVETDWMNQSVSAAIAQFQPNFEEVLRGEIKNLPSVDLRSSHEVLDRTEERDTIVVKYKDDKGAEKEIRTKWLIGADGKRGIVRKKFLEPKGIKQEVGLYHYEATWVAANFKITPPTPESNPKFPLWKLGYTPDEVYEKFWPQAFHFCNDRDMPAVSGRFGPKGSKFWRHEFYVEDENALGDPFEALWKHFGPWLIQPRSAFKAGLKEDSVEFPRDCIEVVRCRSFRFATKVVNRWFYDKTIIIGDAAHVFPPFGGQGIAAGMRDAQSLGWRLGMIERAKLDRRIVEKILTGWSQEQRQRVDDATRTTMVNGRITNQRSAIFSFLFRTITRFLWLFPAVARRASAQAFGDRMKFRNCPDGFFLPRASGGEKVRQIWIRRRNETPILSDSIILRQGSQLGLLVLVDKPEDVNQAQLLFILEQYKIPKDVISRDSITFLSRKGEEIIRSSDPVADDQLYYPCSVQTLEKAGIKAIKGYDMNSLSTRLGRRAKYIIIRPDFFVHSVAGSAEELKQNVSEIKKYLS